LSRHVCFIVLLLTACSSLRQIEIETLHPAGITFPEGVKTVLVVNNAAPQTEVPYLTKLPQKLYADTISADSTAYDFCLALALAIADPPYFEDVRLFEGCYREDSNAVADVSLTQDDVLAFCDEHQVNAVISLDQLLFKIEDNYEQTWMGLTGNLNFIVSGVLRTYLPDRTGPLNTVYLSDTIAPVWNSEYFYTLPSMKELAMGLREVSNYLATGKSNLFVPYWNEDVRWYYTSYLSRWKDAAALAAVENWKDAAAIWLALYEKARSWKEKARLASNLALTAEISGDYEKALSWATLSYQIFEERLGDSHEWVKLQKKYVEVLEYRINAEKKLHLQMKHVTGMEKWKDMR